MNIKKLTATVTALAMLCGFSVLPASAEGETTESTVLTETAVLRKFTITFWTNNLIIRYCHNHSPCASSVITLVPHLLQKLAPS